MKTTLVLLLLLFTLSSSQYIAQAILKGTASEPTLAGTVTFSQPAGEKQSVVVSVNITGITNEPNGLHGIHIHEFGDISDQALGMAAGGHFVGSAGSPHGCPENANAPRHFGDMGNWQATAGSIVQTKTLDLLTLHLNDSIVGRSVILHNATDDCVTVPTGNSGARLAQGVIGVVNATKYGGTLDASQTNGNITTAICVLQSASGSNVTGTVWFQQSGIAGTTRIFAQIFGITGPHGFHIHGFGDISDPAGLATGSHWNPLGSKHGIPPFSERHAGDLGIISFYENGTAFYDYTNDRVTLNGQSGVIGRAVHVHENSDDCSDPVGKGGNRWAQCVIGISSVPTLPSTATPVPTTQAGLSICEALSSIQTTSASSSVSASSDFSFGASSRSRAPDDSPASILSIGSAVFLFAMAFCF